MKPRLTLKNLSLTYLLQCLLPAVGLITERALELLGNRATGEVSMGSLHVPFAHLLFQMLL